MTAEVRPGGRLPSRAASAPFPGRFVPEESSVPEGAGESGACGLPCPLEMQRGGLSLRAFKFCKWEMCLK